MLRTISLSRAGLQVPYAWNNISKHNDEGYINFHVGERIKERRAAIGISQLELARRSGIPVQHIWNYESHRHGSPSPERLYRIAVSLGLNTIDYLFSGLPDFYPKMLWVPEHPDYEVNRVILREYMAKESEGETRKRSFEFLAKLTGENR